MNYLIIVLFMTFYTIFQGYYCTIHITPQPDYSYVSFETNYPQVNMIVLFIIIIKLLCYYLT